MDANLASTYTLIHSFLTKRSHFKAAQALRKAARDVVVLKSEIEIEGPLLDEIVKQWKEQRLGKTSSASSDAGSESDSSSDDSSNTSSSSSSSSSSHDTSSSSSHSDSDVPSRKNHSLKEVKEDISSSSSSSDSDTDSESSSNSESAKVKKITKKIPKKSTSPSAASSNTLSAGSKHGVDSSDETEEVKSKEKKSRKDNGDSSGGEENTTDSSSGEEDSSSGEEESSSEGALKMNGAEGNSSKEDVKGKAKQRGAIKAESASADPPPTIEEIRVTKRRRTSLSGSAKATATSATVRVGGALQSTGRIKAEWGDSKVNGNGTGGKSAHAPFKRVDPRKVAHVVKDNRYEAKAGPSNDYGQRAHHDLIVTRGAGFRKEKNKKKRGSYRGGEITTQSHSFKFAD